MGFWSGFEGLTGHTPGAFKGFSFKDILDKDLWERKQRVRQQPGWDEVLGRYAKVGEPLFNDRTGEKVMTNWYKGRGRPELMNPRVGATGTGVMENRLMDERPDMFAGANQRAFDATTLANQQRRNALWGSGPSVAHARAARPWANIQAQMLSDPRQVPMQGPGNAQVTRGEPRWIDKTTTVKKSAAVDVPDTTTTVFKEKVQPASIMNMFNMQSWQDVARRKWEERMRARRGY
jgi:hypothetical protein